MMDTEEVSLRCPVIGWSSEDPDIYVPNKPIGMTPSPHIRTYETVLEAMADGWELLGPPVDDGTAVTWWLSKRS